MQPNIIATGFSIGSRLAPGLTAAAAERLFFTTRRSDPRPGERDVLLRATPRQVAGMQAWLWGDGPTVLLVHGWNGRATQLGGFVKPLLARGYRVVAFDALGHGQSPGHSLSLPELAVCVEKVANEVGELHGIIAHSLGGAATTLALSRGLCVERAVFIAPPADPRLFLAAFANALGITNEVRSRVEGRLERRLGIAMQDMQAPRIARSLQTPLLVIHDRNDKEVPVAAGQRIADAWSGAALLLTDGLGHNRILRDDAVIDSAVRFIDAERRLERAA